MDELTDFGFEVREEFMVSPSGAGKPTKKLAHFLQPSINSIEATVFEFPSHCLTSLPASFVPKKWPLTANFHGWRSPLGPWKTWVGKMAALHDSTWKKAGIHEAILNSTYEIRRNYDLVLGLAEKWCPETKSFVFPWGEATITLEDVMISGYSLLGSPFFIRLETDGLKETEEKLNQVRMELNRSTARKAKHGKWMQKFMDSGSEIEHEAFLALWLSRFVFPSSRSLIVKSVFPIAVHLARGTRIALAPAILASIYRDLGLLKEKIVALSEIDNWEDEDSKLAVTISSPLQLVQIWAWDRFIELRPKSNLIQTGEARFAQWHKLMLRVENVRTVLDSAKESFDWRPYAETGQNWNLPKSYGEKHMLVSVNAGLSEELESFARCLRISELVGVDCVEQYLPHRVAMQFGMDQDIPASVSRANESAYIAWGIYNKPINYADLHIPTGLYKAEVTTRYWEWWKRSLSRLQSASCKKISKISEAKKEISFTGFKKSPEKAKGMKDGNIFSGLKKSPNKVKEAKQRIFITSFKRKPKSFDGVNTGVAASIPPNSLKSLEMSSNTSKWKKGDSDSSASPWIPRKKYKKFVETSKEKEEVNDVSAELPSKIFSPSLVVKEEADASPFPPGFPSKSNTVAATGLTEGDADKMTVAELPKYSRKHDDLWNGLVSYGENFAGKSEIFFSTAECKGVKIVESHAELVQKIMQNESANAGSETAMEGSTNNKAGSPAYDMVRIQGVKIVESHAELVQKIMQIESAKAGSETAMEGSTNNKAGSPAYDMVRIQGGERDSNKYASEIPALQLEDRVTRLEKIVAKLKAQDLVIKGQS